jgi:hypothetical protein
MKYQQFCFSKQNTSDRNKTLWPTSLYTKKLTQTCYLDTFQYFQYFYFLFLKDLEWTSLFSNNKPKLINVRLSEASSFGCSQSEGCASWNFEILYHLCVLLKLDVHFKLIYYVCKENNENVSIFWTLYKGDDWVGLSVSPFIHLPKSKLRTVTY